MRDFFDRVTIGGRFISKDDCWGKDAGGDDDETSVHSGCGGVDEKSGVKRKNLRLSSLILSRTSISATQKISSSPCQDAIAFFVKAVKFSLVVRKIKW